MHKVGTCISEVDLNDYLAGSLRGSRKAQVEEHLKDCNECLEKLVFAYEAAEEFKKSESLPAGRQGAKPMKTDWKKNIWLLGAIIVFTLSFIVPRYFVQLLVATILLGTKWIFDSVNARILFMIYDAWKHGGEHEAAQILKTLNRR